jgi:hypothetical protein
MKFPQNVPISPALVPSGTADCCWSVITARLTPAYRERRARRGRYCAGMAGSFEQHAGLSRKLTSKRDVIHASNNLFALADFLTTRTKLPTTAEESFRRDTRLKVAFGGFGPVRGL